MSYKVIDYFGWHYAVKYTVKGKYKAYRLKFGTHDLDYRQLYPKTINVSEAKIIGYMEELKIDM